jgi:hypothetical protein
LRWRNVLVPAQDVVGVVAALAVAGIEDALLFEKVLATDAVIDSRSPSTSTSPVSDSRNSSRPSAIDNEDSVIEKKSSLETPTKPKGIAFSIQRVIRGGHTEKEVQMYIGGGVIALIIIILLLIYLL